MKRVPAASSLLVLSVTVGATSATAAAVPSISSFTVVTSFASKTSEIIEADGVWSDCTGVRDLTNDANQVSPTKVEFSGEKKVFATVATSSSTTTP